MAPRKTDRKIYTAFMCCPDHLEDIQALASRENLKFSVAIREVIAAGLKALTDQRPKVLMR